MGIDWEHGERRYLYTDEEASFARLPVLTRGFAAELLKFAGRDGVIPVGAEVATEVVCRLVGAHMGERRQIRLIVPSLINDGYLTVVPGALVVRNFLTVHYRRDPEKFEAMKEAQAQHLAALKIEHDASRLTHRPVTGEARVQRGSGANGARVVRESGSSEDRVRTESVSKHELSRPNDVTHVEPSGPVLLGEPPNPLAGGPGGTLFELTPEVRPTSKAERVKSVFDSWVKALNKPRAVLDTKRRTLIEARLADGYSVEALGKAMLGCSMSKYHMGDNPDGKRYDGLHLILRDADHVERFIAYADGSETHATRNDLDDWGDAANG